MKFKILVLMLSFSAFAQVEFVYDCMEDGKAVGTVQTAQTNMFKVSDECKAEYGNAVEATAANYRRANNENEFKINRSGKYYKESKGLLGISNAGEDLNDPYYYDHSSNLYPTARQILNRARK